MFSNVTSDEPEAIEAAEREFARAMDALDRAIVNAARQIESDQGVALARQHVVSAVRAFERARSAR